VSFWPASWGIVPEISQRNLRFCDFDIIFHMVSVVLLLALTAQVLGFTHTFTRHTVAGWANIVDNKHTPTRLYENFDIQMPNLGTAEENTPIALLGEKNVAKFINTVDDNSFKNRQYNILERTRELDLLTKTADSGLLSALEKQGVDLETLEDLLPLINKLGVLEVVGNNQQLLLNAVAPLVVEGAPFLLPILAGAVNTGPAAFYGAAAVALGLEGWLVANHVVFLNLNAALFAGLLLVPVAGISAFAGTALAGVKK